MSYEEAIKSLQETAKVVAEITDKLNGLIGYVDRLPKQTPQ